MSFSPEGEILLKEHYGNSTKERYYVKPPEQLCVTVLTEGKKIDPYSWFNRIFLPHEYPHSVSKDYAAYQIWDTAQAFCSTITGTLATQEVLRGVGVGDTSATPLAATVTWVIKDGCGHIGRILFACTHGTQLDAYSKKWRLYADVLNDAAMCIEISLPLFRNYTTFALCVSTTMKAIVGVAGGATRAALTQHHALRGNLADVSAKDSAQETAVNLIASITALFLITLFGNSVSLFLFTMVLHITFNYLAVRAVCLRTLNEPRFLQVISTYVVREVIPTPCEVNRHEPIFFHHMGNSFDLRICGFHIKMGCSLKQLTDINSKADHLVDIRSAYARRRYVVWPVVGEREMCVLLRENACTNDILCAYFHAVLLSMIVCAINGEPLLVYQEYEDPRPFARLCHTLQAADWSRSPAPAVGFSGFLHEPSLDLLKFLNNVVDKEWRIFRTGLTRTGWDISKHLLLYDEWRISCHALESKEVLDHDDEDEILKKFSNLNDSDPFISKEIAAQTDDTCIIEPEDSQHSNEVDTKMSIMSNMKSLKKTSSLRFIPSHLRINETKPIEDAVITKIKEKEINEQNTEPAFSDKVTKKD